MHVAELWRYPVKSMAGERIESARPGSLGIPGDRAWALRESGNTRNAKKFPALMAMQARYDVDPSTDPAPPIITLQDGSAWRANDPETAKRISHIIGTEVSISPLAPADNLAFYRRRERRTLKESREIFGLEENEPFPDVSRFPRLLAEFSTPPGTFFDCYPLLIMTTASLRALQQAAPDSRIDVRRFRPNILIDTDGTDFVENAWSGKTLEIGEARIRLTLACPRCVMTTIGFDDLPRDTGIMRTLVQVCRQELGVYAEVEVPGTIAVGDDVTLYDSAF